MFRILFLIWLSVHPVHVTITSIDYIPENKSFKGFVRVFMDDLLADCKLHGYITGPEEFPGNSPGAIKTLEKYLNDKLIISVNGNIIQGRLEEVRINGNEVDIDIMFKDGAIPETMTVKNEIMTDLYDDQSNMLIVKVSDFEQGVRLTSDTTEQTFLIN